MVDLAHLGIAVDSSQAEQGTLALDKLASAAKKVEQTASQMGSAVSTAGKQAADATSKIGEGAKKAEKEAEKLGDALQDAGKKASSAAAETEKAGSKLGSALSKGARESTAAVSALSDAAEQVGIDITGAARATEAATARVTSAVGKQRDELGRFVKGAGGALGDAIGAATGGGGVGGGNPLDRLTKGANDNAKAVGLARHEWTNLSRQMQDVITMGAMGASPMQIVTSQGAQVFDALSSSSVGAKAAVTEVGATILRVATHPLTLLTAGLAAAAYATYQFSQQQTALERSLNGVGRLSGASVGDLRGIATDASRNGSLSYGQAVDATAQFAGAGIGVENIPTLLAASQRYAHAFGTDLQDAQDEIAQMVGGEGLGAMEKRFGPISFGVKEMVRSLEASGRYAEATALKTRMLDDETRKAKDTASELSKVWEGVVKWATTPVFGLGGKISAAIHGPTLEQQLAAARGEYFYLRAQRRGDASAYPGEAAAQQRVQQLEQQLQEERARPARERRDLELNRLSDRAGSIIDANSSDLGQLRGLRESRDALKQLLGSDEGLAKLRDRADEARHTLSNLENQIVSWRSVTDRMREDSALQIREITAQTYAQREAVAMERARINVLRETGDITRAAVAAESERARMIAESTKKVEDLARTSRDNLALAYASNPLERRMMEINNQQRDFARENLPNSATAPVTREFDAAAISARNLTSAFDGLAAKISGGSASNVINFTPRGALSAADPRNLSGYIRERAGAYGIDPETALRVARSEGLANFYGDNRTSFGAMQLHIGGGIGDEFRRDTGLDPSNPANERATIDYALKIAAQRGWGPWHGAARVGIGQWEGIGGRAAGNAAGAGTLGASANASYDMQRSAADYEARIKTQEDFAKSIIASRDALETRVQTLGMDQRAIDEATKRQELMNEAIKTTGNILPEQQKWIDVNAAAWADYQEELRRVNKAEQQYKENLDLARSTLSGSLSGGLKALAKGEDVGAALQQSMSSAMDRMIDMQANRLTESLLGATGSTNGGLLGDLLGFGRQQNVANANIQAGVVNLTGGVGTGTGGLGGLIGSLFSGSNSGALPTTAQGGMGPDYLPGYNADGTDYWRGGPTWVGEKGPELVNLPRGASVMPNAQSLAYARALAAAGWNDNARAAAPMGKSEVHFHGAPEGTKMKETTDGNGNRRFDVTFDEAVVNTLGKPSGVRALRGAGRLTRY